MNRETKLCVIENYEDVKDLIESRFETYVKAEKGKGVRGYMTSIDFLYEEVKINTQYDNYRCSCCSDMEYESFRIPVEAILADDQEFQDILKDLRDKRFGIEAEEKEKRKIKKREKAVEKEALRKKLESEKLEEEKELYIKLKGKYEK
jgi:hypothetical protein